MKCYLIILLLIIVIPTSLAIDYCKTLDSEGAGWGYSYGSTYGHDPVDLSQGYIGHNEEYLYLKWIWMGEATCNSIITAYLDIDPEEEITYAEYIINWIPEDCVDNPQLYPLNKNGIYTEEYEFVGQLDFTYTPSKYTTKSGIETISGGVLEVKIPREGYSLKEKTGISMKSYASNLYGGDKEAFNDEVKDIIFEYDCYGAEKQSYDTKGTPTEGPKTEGETTGCKCSTWIVWLLAIVIFCIGLYLQFKEKS